MQLIPPPEAFELVDLIVVVVAVGGRKILFSCCAKTEKNTLPLIATAHCRVNAGVD